MKPGTIIRVLTSENSTIDYILEYVSSYCYVIRNKEENHFFSIPFFEMDDLFVGEISRTIFLYDFRKYSVLKK